MKLMEVLIKTILSIQNNLSKNLGKTFMVKIINKKRADVATSSLI